MSLMLTRTGNFDACTAINPGGICPIIKREVKFTTETVKNHWLRLRRRQLKMRNHPYEEYENTDLWNTIWMAIDDLVKNQDLKERTPRAYIVGYLCEKILKDGTL